MRRREFVACLGGLLAPLLAFGQQPVRRARVSILVDGTAETTAQTLRVMRGRLRELGWVEGRNLVIDERYSEGVRGRLPALADELLAQEPDVILTLTTTATKVAVAATNKVPIVFGPMGDPITAGIVESLSRPGGNVTGQSLMASEMAPKWLELLLELVPEGRKFALLGQSRNPGITPVFAGMEAAAKARNLDARLLDATTLEEVQRAFELMVAEGFDGFATVSAPIVLRNRRQIAALAARHRLPGVYAREEYVAAGGLLSFVADRASLYRRTAEQVHRVLEGMSPGDLPVEQPTKFVLTVNLRAARAMELAIPQSLLIRADRVIE
ncbi:MAG: ABC transporter substrate-binding protein [Burkholderiales bacterium]